MRAQPAARRLPLAFLRVAYPSAKSVIQLGLRLAVHPRWEPIPDTMRREASLPLDISPRAAAESHRDTAAPDAIEDCWKSRAAWLLQDASAPTHLAPTQTQRAPASQTPFRFLARAVSVVETLPPPRGNCCGRIPWYPATTSPPPISAAGPGPFCTARPPHPAGLRRAPRPLVVPRRQSLPSRISPGQAAAVRRPATGKAEK